MPLIDLIDKLQQSLPSGTVLTGEPMARHTTFRVGGPADVMVLADSGADIQKTVALCREENYPFIILGNGSNVLVRDGGIPGLCDPHGRGVLLRGSLGRGRRLCPRWSQEQPICRDLYGTGARGMRIHLGDTGHHRGSGVYERRGLWF